MGVKVTSLFRKFTRERVSSGPAGREGSEGEGRPISQKDLSVRRRERKVKLPGNSIKCKYIFFSRGIPTDEKMRELFRVFIYRP